jgi:hypothetical protein
MDAVVRVVDARGRTVASGRTSRQGRVTLRLAPGRYRVSAGNARPGVLPACRPVPARVAKGRWTRVAISCDTGIR